MIIDGVFVLINNVLINGFSCDQKLDSYIKSTYINKNMTDINNDTNNDTNNNYADDKFTIIYEKGPRKIICITTKIDADVMPLIHKLSTIGDVYSVNIKQCINYYKSIDYQQHKLRSMYENTY